MAPLSLQDIEVVREAIKARLHNEELERAVGRVLRNRGSAFDDYVRIMGELREEARRQGRPLDDVAKELSEGPR